MKDINFVKLLEQELKSCCLPKIKDVDRADINDVIRDMYRVLGGNGGMTYGLLFKVAAANVTIQQIKEQIDETASTLEKQAKKLDEQISKCNAIQQEKEKQEQIKKAEELGERKFFDKIRKLGVAPLSIICLISSLVALVVGRMDLVFDLIRFIYKVFDK